MGVAILVAALLAVSIIILCAWRWKLDNSNDRDELFTLFNRDGLLDLYPPFRNAGFSSIDDIDDEVVDRLLMKYPEGKVRKLKRLLSKWKEKKQVVALTRPVPNLPENKPIPEGVAVATCRSDYSSTNTKMINVKEGGNKTDENSWESVPFGRLSQVDMLKLFRQCNLQKGFYVDQSGQFFAQGKTPILLFKNVDLLSAVSSPAHGKFDMRACLSHKTEFESFQLMGGGEANFRFNSPSAPCIDARVQTAIEATKTELRKNELVCATASAVCTYATVDLGDITTLNPDVLSGLRTAINSGNTVSQRYFKLLEKAKEYGIVVIQSCDIGVRADCRDLREVHKQESDGAFRASFQAAAASALGLQASKELASSMTVTVKGPDMYVRQGQVQDLIKCAGNISDYVCVTLRSATTIIDLVLRDESDPELRETVAEAVRWFKSWDTVTKEGPWVNVQPLNFDWFTVWLEEATCCIQCHQFPTNGEAVEFFQKKGVPGCVCFWDGGKCIRLKKNYGFVNWYTQLLVNHFTPHGPWRNFQVPVPTAEGIVACAKGFYDQQCKEYTPKAESHEQRMVRYIQGLFITRVVAKKS